MNWWGVLSSYWKEVLTQSVVFTPAEVVFCVSNFLALFSFFILNLLPCIPCGSAPDKLNILHMFLTSLIGIITALNGQMTNLLYFQIVLWLRNSFLKLQDYPSILGIA